MAEYKKYRIYMFAAILVLLFGLVAFIRSTNYGASFIWEVSKQGSWLLPLVIISSLIDSINPCAFSILLLTIAFLFSIGKLRTNVLKIGLAYILGIFLVYVLIGLGILHALHLFSTPHFMAKLGASLLIVLGIINLINEFFPKFPIKLKIPHSAHRKMAQLVEKASLPTAFILGLLVGLCEFPCTGGPYLMILGLLHDRMTYVKGLAYLLLYNIIFVLPLVIILISASDKALIEKIQNAQQEKKHAMRIFGGIAMVGLGIIIFLF